MEQLKINFENAAQVQPIDVTAPIRKAGQVVEQWASKTAETKVTIKQVLVLHLVFILMILAAVTASTSLILGGTFAAASGFTCRYFLDIIPEGKEVSHDED